MKTLGYLMLLLCTVALHSQESIIKGKLLEDSENPVIFANIALYSQSDSSLVKVETSDNEGIFAFNKIAPSTYYVIATYIGFDDLVINDILLGGEDLDLGTLTFKTQGVELAEAIVTARRAMVEVKADRTVFNVQGTINSTGSDAIALLRKAPGVTVDNNDNINVLGRSGVLLYVDGKRLPLTGEDLKSYLQSLSAEQIDRMDIITNPGAKYEAEGNAGIIDIKLKKNENHGANGSFSSSISKGRHATGNANFTGNFRNKVMNVFGTIGTAQGTGFSDVNFLSYQNSLELTETNMFKWNYENYNFRAGTDFFLNDHHTLGVLITGSTNDGSNESKNRISIAQASTRNIDSILIADNNNNSTRNQNTYNINYRYEGENQQSLNIDLDYGAYRSDINIFQPNLYYNASESDIISEVINTFETPSDIDIYTFKVDYESTLLGGKLGLGSKLSKVVSDNTFLFFDQIDGQDYRNDQKSNQFKYDENVYAGYLTYSRKLTDKWSMVAGLRAEQTDATGDLQAFDTNLAEPPVELNYLSWFPNAGLTYLAAENHNFSLNYGRRINRPDYNVLNPFNFQISQLSFEKGNPFLRPEIVNNFELGYTYAYRYNFKLGYSKTTDQITRLIAPDDIDPRASFFSWDNLAEQTIFSFSASAPVQINEKWNVYTNFSASQLDNQADYGEGAIVDLQAFTYNIYQQHTINLPYDFTGEVSGYFAGPGIWGGVFKFETSYSLNFGLQRKFFDKKMNVRLSVNDVFYQTGWDGYSEFNGLLSYGNGNWDSRRGSLSISYNFGNQKVKSRNRKTGIEDEADRISSGNQ